MSYDNILFEIQNGIAILTLNRPDTLNSLSIQLMAETRDAIKCVAEDQKIHVLVITGSGKGFSAGADLAGGGRSNESGNNSNLSVGEYVSESAKNYYNPVINDIDRIEKPVIAAVNGVVVGGGVGLALSTDIVIAARSAKFILPFGPKLGIVPDMGSTWFYPRLIGRARSLALALLGDRLPAKEAAEWGLIYKCVDDEILMDEVMAIAEKLAQGPQKAYGYIKKAFKESYKNRLDDQLEFERYCQRVLCDSDDFKEGVTAFIEKRKPRFKGR
ncbi:MAG: enoyl-CoA hydratase/isomerase family protein [Deltaproteobacteria bacterium]|nr:enoyl-CoA hydratase/isomerase family protein [Deltaproteobacteria bacterium]